MAGLEAFIFKELINSRRMGLIERSGPPLCLMVVQIADLYDFTVP